MSSKKFATTPVISIQRSPSLLLTISCGYIVAIIIVSVFIGPTWIKIALLLTLLLGYALFILHYGWLGEFGIRTLSPINNIFAPVVAVQCNAENKWNLVLENGNTKGATLLGSSYRSINIVILNFSLENSHFLFRRKSLVLTKDNLDQNSFRYLRVRLGLGVNPTEGS